MNPIDPNTLAAIGGQKATEAAKTFADTMLQLYRTKKEAALLDQQTEAARLQNVRTQATQPTDIEADVATNRAKTQEATEFVSPEAKSTRNLQQKATSGEALKALSEYENFFKTLPERQQIEMNQLATQKAVTQMQSYQGTLANLPAQGSTATGFASWKSQNPDLVERMNADSQLAKIMKKQALTMADSRIIQSKQEQIIGQTPEWAEYYMKTMLEHRLAMEQLGAKAAAEKAAKEPNTKWESTSAEQFKADMTGELGIDNAPSQTAVDAYVGWSTAIKNNDVPPVPNERLTSMLKNMAKTGTKIGKDDTNYVAAQAGSAMAAYKNFISSGGQMSAAPFLAPMYNLDSAQADNVYQQWVESAGATGRNPTLDDLWYLANLASVSKTNKGYFTK